MVAMTTTQYLQTVKQVESYKQLCFFCICAHASTECRKKLQHKDSSCFADVAMFKHFGTTTD